MKGGPILLIGALWLSGVPPVMLLVGSIVLLAQAVRR